MSLLKINIKNEGENWHKRIYLFGIMIYHRHEYKELPKPIQPIGFNTGQYCPGEILEEY